MIRIAAFGILLTVAACAEPGPGSQPDPTGVAWELMEGTMDGDELTLVETHPITLTIEDDAASGTAACNRYFASVAISGAAIGFDGLGATEMACSPEEIMESEEGQRRLAGFMLRRHADRVAATHRSGRSTILFHFDH